MIPFHFGPSDRPLFGIYQPPADNAPADRAVLLCNPFGQEAVRGHRIYRVLAARLVRERIAVLRFDYHATGDSPGADEEGELEGWTGDVRVALHELVARSGVARVVCVGARLGGTLALRGAGGQPETMRLVLWDPVVDGADYLALLRRKHVESLESTFSVPDPAWRQQLAHDPQAYTAEAIGFAMSERLRGQIRALAPDTLRAPAGADVHVLAHPADAAVNAWVASPALRAARCSHWPIEESFDWTASQRPGSPIVPAPALARLMATIRG
jgi:alpha-beta hydrolase superfamily lysophospholipase